MKEEIVKACQEMDLSGLEEKIGDFTLTIDQKETETSYELFHYQNDKGWKWQALYDQEVEDYTVHIIMPLFGFTDISFVRANASDYITSLKERYKDSLVKSLVKPELNFTYAYKTKGLPDWAYEPFLPSQVGCFSLDITPHNAIQMINGSFIIAEYKNGAEPSGLLLFYNVLRDEFFAESRLHNYPEINHDLDATTIAGLEDVLQLNLKEVLTHLEERL